ncbi:hypothetical protein SLS55_000197 [Diplodia seriata]|uniref:Uncharacterized protein n=1 Tax=Diplodia seriata TaxID=420778 RepID=A0ABR3CW45_9PEZI
MPRPTPSEITREEFMTQRLSEMKAVCSTLGTVQEFDEYSYDAEVLIVDEASTIKDPSAALALMGTKNPSLLILTGDPTQGIVIQHAPTSPVSTEMGTSTLSRVVSNVLAEFETMPIEHGDENTVPTSKDESISTPQYDNRAKGKVPDDLEGGVAEELHDQPQDFVAEVKADEEGVRPLPEWLTQGLTDYVKASYKPPTFWRATILEVQTDSGSAFYGSFDSYSIRSKTFSSALLPMIVFTLDAAKASRGNDVMLDPDECTNVTFELLGGDDPASTAVRKFSPEMDCKLAAFRFIGKPAPRDAASKVHPIYKITQRRQAMRGFAHFGWYSRDARYHTIANEPFYEFRMKGEFPDVPNFLRPPDDETEAWPLVPRNTSKFYGTRSTFLNVHRVGYLYEMEAVNAAHAATFVMKYQHNVKVSKRLRALHIEVTIVPQGTQRMVCPILGTLTAVHLYSKLRKFDRVLEGRVSWVARSSRKFSFDVPPADFPLDMLDTTLPARVTCSATSQWLQEEYDSMNALAETPMDGGSGSDFWGVQATQGKETTKPASQEPDDSEDGIPARRVKKVKLALETFEVEVNNNDRPLQKPKMDYYGKLKPKTGQIPKHVTDVVEVLKGFTGNRVEMNSEKSQPKSNQKFLKLKIYHLKPELSGSCGCSDSHTLFQHHFTQRGDIRDSTELRIYGPKTGLQFHSLTTLKRGSR